MDTPQTKEVAPDGVNKDLQRLEALRSKNADPTWVNGDLYRLMYKTDLYIVAYEKLKSKPGNMTPGPDKTTLDGFSDKTIENIVRSMRDESFEFSRARRVHIPKAKGGTRPLGIAPPRDKVVQEVMRMILEAIYDSPHGSSFTESSHGFRPGRGCHTALRSIYQEWSGVTWIVEGDVKAAFDNVDHDILLRALGKRVKDERFLNLIRKALTAGYYEFKTPVNSIVGTPQGSVLSPILCNVYLHELDQHMAEVMKAYNKGKARTRNPAYRSIETRLGRIRKAIDLGPDQGVREALVEEVRELKRKMNTVSPIVDDGEYVRIRYVRYADDFVIGVNGPGEIAKKIRQEVADFMEGHLGLTLSMEKTHIRHAKTEEAFFLGTRVKIGTPTPRIRGYQLHGRHVTRRTAGWNARLLAPVPKLVVRLQQKGFCDEMGTPRAKRPWAALDDEQIVALFDSVLRGLLGYYSFASNFGELSRIQFILQLSCAKTLAMKHRTSARKIFRKYGRRITIKRTVRIKEKEVERSVSLDLRTTWAATPKEFRIGIVTEPDDVLVEMTRLRTRSKLGLHCAICGEKEDVEMHHVRHIRKMGDKVKGFSRLLAKINRKQIPACKGCHKKIHRGTYDGMSLKDLYDPDLAAS